MRVKFRVSIYKDGKKLKKADLVGKRDPLSIGLRYILEFKYLESTKWLMLSEDSYEKYFLLGLINKALGQDHQAKEFFQEAEKHPPKTSYTFQIEHPQSSSL
ncbi:MAG: hypothetical protein KNN13_07660 [Hydrogenobacter thermophilus]|uniref:hypothetical protein n=1 Tax=Hydrogenobacter thermophilus TaxID=940 RepID=UPI001C746F3C|nr:hypothetical protein [Hydrogenobacter thermophilus]QWK19366.1 MAG: hypothetical protein KNN13_07660 [Hydrogenobacter thermophilus]